MDSHTETLPHGAVTEGRRVHLDEDLVGHPLLLQCLVAMAPRLLHPELRDVELLPRIPHGLHLHTTAGASCGEWGGG